MKHVSIGKYVIPSWILGVVLAGICIGAFALYMTLSFTVPFEVKEPIEVLYYPSQLSLYPGDTLYFNVTVQNHASQNYTMFLDFSLDNTTYENNYVTFSNATYFVRPGVQNLTAWVAVSAEAPSINAALSINFFREASQDSYAEYLVVTSVEFSSSGTMINITVNNAGVAPVTISEVWINNIKRMAYPPLPQTVAAGNELTLSITYQWVSGNTYQIKLTSLRGNQFTYAAIAPSDVIYEESLHVTKQHVWYNTTGSWAEAAMVIINTGGRDVVIDTITVRGQEVSWSNVYYWKTNNTTITNDLQVTSTPITGDTFNITIQGAERVFQRATSDLSLEVGWTVVVYIMNPDSITSNDIGVTIGITVFTANAQYHKETNVEAADQMVTEQLTITSILWASPEGSSIPWVLLTVRNTGSIGLSIAEVRVNYEIATTNLTLPYYLSPEMNVSINITRTFTPGTMYEFWIITSNGNKFSYLAVPPS